MFWAYSADGRGAVPLPKPRPVDAPGVQDSRGGQREKNNLPRSGGPEAEPSSADEKASEQTTNEKAAHKPAEPPPSPCRLALTEAIAIAPSLPPIRGPGACGGEDLVRLEAVVLAGGKRVPMKPAAILRCTMASAIADWVRSDMAALAEKLGSGLSEVDNFDSFECRGRNRIKGAQLSEHGKANALDVRGVKLASGRFISLTDRSESREVREQVLLSVCKRFATVLGPGSDWYHEDHIHLDLAERRGNYRICQWNVYDPLPAVAPLLPAERPDEAPPREVAGAEHPAQQQSAPVQQQPSQPAPAQQQQAEPQATEAEVAEPVPAAPAAKSKQSKTKAAKAAAKSRAPKSRTPEAATSPTPAESAPSQPDTSEPAASETAQPDTSAQPAEPTPPQPNAAPPAAAKPPPAKKKRKRRQQPSFFGLPLPKF
ncbi:extensin family protein [Bradyrhizobium prioriisuperbiae]|uniref:extensin family protein n=1 Tax=Bradyrhizobium prioriisuperbiae TaxID=2854389 RepID=UPI0028EFD693|nr:extensin family protein [Bradyrhizobium prioritasuperba]